jgi:dTDP-4-amino-4,6-dideoxygalactose transaminase
VSRICLSKADVTGVEQDYVLDAMRSGWIAPLGPHVDAFEREVAERVGLSHALAMSSGTAALHLALLGIGVKPGTAVVLPSMTFAASAWPVVYCGADPVFVDSGEDANLDAGLFLDAIDTLRREGQTVAAAISVDLFGRCAEYDEIVSALAEREIPLVEDAAEALGASYHGRPAGAFGTASILSFNGNKIMTTSGGGMLLSDDADLVARARYLSTQARQPTIHYEHTEVGYNYRLSNVLAALGRGQLSRLDEMLARRREIRWMYASALGDVPGVQLLGRGVDGRSDDEDSCWLTCMVLDPAVTGVEAGQVMAALDAEDIESRPLWKPMHLQPVFAGARVFVNGTSQRLFERGVALPSGSGLTDRDIERVIGALRSALARRLT